MPWSDITRMVACSASGRAASNRPISASAAFDKLAAYVGHAWFAARPYYRYVMRPGITWEVWLMVGVLGGANLYQELIKQYSTRTIGKQPIEVRKLPRSAEVERCHILFVGKGELGLLPEIYKRHQGKPTMIITEYAGALEDGAVVNFVKVDNMLKYELDMANAKTHGLVVGLTLKNLAHRVQE